MSFELLLLTSRQATRSLASLAAASSVLCTGTHRKHAALFGTTYLSLPVIYLVPPEQRYKHASCVTVVVRRSTVDAVFFAYVLRSYSRTNKYTAAILAYVLGAGVFTVAAAPNFARLFKRQQEDEGALQPKSKAHTFAGGFPWSARYLGVALKEKR